MLEKSNTLIQKGIFEAYDLGWRIRFNSRITVELIRQKNYSFYFLQINIFIQYDILQSMFQESHIIFYATIFCSFVCILHCFSILSTRCPILCKRTSCTSFGICLVFRREISVVKSEILVAANKTSTILLLNSENDSVSTLR